MSEGKSITVKVTITKPDASDEENIEDTESKEEDKKEENSTN